MKISATSQQFASGKNNQYPLRSQGCLSLVLLAASVAGGCGGGGTSANSPILSQSLSEPVASSSAASSVEFTHQPDALSHAPFARFEFNSDQAASFECRSEDEPTYEPCNSPTTLLPLESGDHTFYVRAIDNQGGAEEPAQVAWAVASIFAATDARDIHPDLIPTSVEPAQAQANSWRGILRINCDFAHSSFDDPIVFPGQKGAAHLHRFYGNTLLDENSNFESLFTEGESSCQGNELNRSAYWIPALLAPAYDPVSGQRLFDDFGEPAFKAVPAVVGNNDEAHEVFYYSAGVDDLESIETIPSGLVMIAGDHMAQPGSEQDTAIARWHCQTWESTDAGNPRWSAAIPECTAPDRLRMDIFFPSCWNGFDLDSHNHKSHLAYPESSGTAQGTVCPDSHPVPIIRVSFHYAFGVTPDVYEPQSRSTQGWKLASDMYPLAAAESGGISLHGDWFNAWHPEALQAVLDHCIKGALDCHDGNLANGYRLSGTREGQQTEPDIIKTGL